MARTRWIASAAVALLAAAPYIRSVGFEFVLDDLHLIVHNAFLREAWSPITAFAHDFWHGTSFGASYYRPVVTASFALNGRLLGWGPGGFHLVNVLLHAANAVLLLALARRLGCLDRAALCAAALFAVHPVAAWPVASIVARVDLLPTLFILLAWCVLCRPAGGRVGLPGAARVGTFFLLALLSKESAAAFLAVPILALRRMKDPDGGIRDCRPVAISVGAAALVYLAARRALGLGLLMAPGLIDPLTNPLALLPRSARLLAALRLAGRYMLYLLAPIRFTDPRNYFEPAAQSPLMGPGVIMSLALLALWSGSIVLLWLRRDPIALPLAFALASFLPASNILFPIGSLYAQNFLYMPLAGACLAAAGVLGRAERRAGTTGAPTSRPAGIARTLVAGTLAAVLVLAAFAEAGIWRDDLSLLTAWSERFPNYPLAQSALGVALLDRHDPAAAVAPLRRALALTDRSLEAHYNLGVALLLLGRPAEAEREARAALLLAPGFAPALQLLDRTARRSGSTPPGAAWMPR